MEHPFIEQYTSFLERVLTPMRYQHSLGVMQVMGELAEIYGIDLQKAVVSGLLHDAAKDLDPLEQPQLIQEAAIMIEVACEHNYSLYLHAPVGAYYVSKELGVKDVHILEAIRTHSFIGKGEGFHSPLSWCLRFADVLESNRTWSDVRWFREGKTRLHEAVYSGRLTEAAYLQTGWLIKMFEEKGFPVHPNIRQVKQEFANQLKVDDSFLE
jgi:predicted HD superfamily hydrolase involved in NAD metabolism